MYSIFYLATVKMIKFFICAIFSLVSAAEVKENVTETTEMFTQLVPTTARNEVKNEDMLRITQPSNSNLAIKEVDPNSTEVSTKKSVFRASPQLESYIEFNRFPVQPAWPEPKQVKTFHQIQNYIKPQTPYHSTKFFGASSTIIPTTSEAEEKQSFFQTGKPLRSDSDHNPLKFYDKYNYGPPASPVFPTAPSVPNFDWLNSESYSKPGGEHPYSFDEPKRDVVLATPHNVVYDESDSVDVSTPRRSPWKKVIKFLATVIPIGILLSALTPNILNIGPPINATQ